MKYKWMIHLKVYQYNMELAPQKSDNITISRLIQSIFLKR